MEENERKQNNAAKEVGGIEKIIEKRKANDLASGYEADYEDSPDESSPEPELYSAIEHFEAIAGTEKQNTIWLATFCCAAAALYGLFFTLIGLIIWMPASDRTFTNLLFDLSFLTMIGTLIRTVGVYLLATWRLRCAFRLMRNNILASPEAAYTDTELARLWIPIELELHWHLNSRCIVQTQQVASGILVASVLGMLIGSICDATPDDVLAWASAQTKAVMTQANKIIDL
ncbi:Fc.00g028990.m01.CDS01 [Cosmosporella sp. VM-42]